MVAIPILPGWVCPGSLLHPCGPLPATLWRFANDRRPTTMQASSWTPPRPAALGSLLPCLALLALVACTETPAPGSGDPTDTGSTFLPQPDVVAGTTDTVKDVKGDTTGDGKGQDLSLIHI